MESKNESETLKKCEDNSAGAETKIELKKIKSSPSIKANEAIKQSAADTQEAGYPLTKTRIRSAFMKLPVLARIRSRLVSKKSISNKRLKHEVSVVEEEQPEPVEPVNYCPTPAVEVPEQSDEPEISSDNPQRLANYHVSSLAFIYQRDHKKFNDETIPQEQKKYKAIVAQMLKEDSESYMDFFLKAGPVKSLRESINYYNPYTQSISKCQKSCYECDKCKRVCDICSTILQIISLILTKKDDFSQLNHPTFYRDCLLMLFARHDNLVLYVLRCLTLICHHGYRKELLQAFSQFFDEFELTGRFSIFSTLLQEFHYRSGFSTNTAVELYSFINTFLQTDVNSTIKEVLDRIKIRSELIGFGNRPRNMHGEVANTLEEPIQQYLDNKKSDEKVVQQYLSSSLSLSHTSTPELETIRTWQGQEICESSASKIVWDLLNHGLDPDEFKAFFKRKCEHDIARTCFGQRLVTSWHHPEKRFPHKPFSETYSLTSDLKDSGLIDSNFQMNNQASFSPISDRKIKKSHIQVSRDIEVTEGISDSSNDDIVMEGEEIIGGIKDIDAVKKPKRGKRKRGSKPTTPVEKTEVHVDGTVYSDNKAPITHNLSSGMLREDREVIEDDKKTAIKAVRSLPLQSGKARTSAVAISGDAVSSGVIVGVSTLGEEPTVKLTSADGTRVSLKSTPNEGSLIAPESSHEIPAAPIEPTEEKPAEEAPKDIPAAPIEPTEEKPVEVKPAEEPVTDIPPPPTQPTEEKPVEVKPTEEASTDTPIVKPSSPGLEKPLSPQETSPPPRRLGGPPPPPSIGGPRKAMNKPKNDPPLPKPKNKVRPINLCDINRDSYEKSVWKQIDQLEVFKKYKLECLDDIFEAVTPISTRVSIKKNENDSKNSNKVTMLEPNRNQNILISARKVNQEPEELARIIKTLNQDKILKEDQLEKLHNFLPSDTEKTTYTQMTAEQVENLQLADQFLYHLSKIPLVEKRVDLMKNSVTLASHLEGNLQDARMIERTIDLLKASEGLRAFMAIVLTSANYMKNKNRRAYSGCRISSLKAISSVKSSKIPNMTMMNVVANILSKEEPNLCNFDMQLLTALDNVLKVDVSELRKDTSSHQSYILNLTNLLSSPAVEADESFSDAIKSFIETHKSAAEEVGEIMQGIDKKTIQFIDHFGEDKTSPLCVIFEEFNSLLAQYRKAKSDCDTAAAMSRPGIPGLNTNPLGPRVSSVKKLNKSFQNLVVDIKNRNSQKNNVAPSEESPSPVAE